MDDNLDRPKQRVTALLTAAREIAWDAFDPPSDEAVMKIFDRLCFESNRCGQRYDMDEDDDEVVVH